MASLSGPQPDPAALRRGHPTAVPRRPLLALERRLLLGFDSLARRFRRRPAQPVHLETGLRGELEAFYFLRQAGFSIAARRWRCEGLKGDLDLVAWETVYERPFLCFVEVKTRTARDMTPAGLAVDQHKRHMLRLMSKAYLRTLPPAMRSKVATRFDILSVYLLPGGVECELVRGIEMPD